MVVIYTIKINTFCSYNFIYITSSINIGSLPTNLEQPTVRVGYCLLCSCVRDQCDHIKN